ncbi:MAG: hypothetical protein AB1Z55_06275 [Acidimicrobiia bacterium]
MSSLLDTMRAEVTLADGIVRIDGFLNHVVRPRVVEKTWEPGRRRLEAAGWSVVALVAIDADGTIPEGAGP